MGFKVKGLTFRSTQRATVTSGGGEHAPATREKEILMKMRLFGIAAALVAMSGTAAAAATKVAAAGCCPLCR